MSDATPTGYAARLGISAPIVEDQVDSGAKLFHLMILALIENSAPMTLDELVRRLGHAGVGSRIGDLKHSLQKAWHGLPPVIRGKDGRFDLDLDSDELRFLMNDLGLKAPRSRDPGDEPPAPPRRGDHEPLVEAEVKVVMGSTGLSSLRQTAAILDMTGTPMTAEEIDAYSRAASARASRIAGRNGPRSGWHTDLVTTDESGRLAINRASAALVPMRQAVRKLAQPTLIQEAKSAFFSARWKAGEAEREAKKREDAAKATTLRRAVLRVFTARSGRAAALVGLADRSIRSFMPEQFGDLPAALGDFEVLIGLDLREHLVDLGLDAGRWRLIDVGPPQKTLRINKSGRTLKITTEMLMSHTVGLSRALGDAKKTATYMADGDFGKLRRRIESDAKNVAAYYAYGALHGYVRLRWGFLNERLGVAWALPGEPRLFGLLKQSVEQRQPVEVVLGWSAPGWEEPWSRARRATAVKAEHGWVTFDDGRERFDERQEEIQAIRIVGG